MLVFKKALYELRSSKKMWHNRLFDCLSELEFTPYQAVPDIWILTGILLKNALEKELGRF